MVALPIDAPLLQCAITHAERFEIAAYAFAPKLVGSARAAKTVSTSLTSLTNGHTCQCFEGGVPAMRPVVRCASSLSARSFASESAGESGGRTVSQSWYAVGGGRK